MHLQNILSYNYERFYDTIMKKIFIIINLQKILIYNYERFYDTIMKKILS